MGVRFLIGESGSFAAHHPVSTSKRAVWLSEKMGTEYLQQATWVNPNIQTTGIVPGLL